MLWGLHLNARFLDTTYLETDKKHKNIHTKEWVTQYNNTLIFSNKLAVYNFRNGPINQRKKKRHVDWCAVLNNAFRTSNRRLVSLFSDELDQFQSIFYTFVELNTRRRKICYVKHYTANIKFHKIFVSNSRHDTNRIHRVKQML